MGLMPRALLPDVLTFLGFYSRLPFGEGAHAPLDFARMAPALPIAGAVIGATGAAALVVARMCHLPPLVCALISVAVLVLATGALHEDGLADVADGFGGGATREVETRDHARQPDRSLWRSGAVFFNPAARRCARVDP